MESRIIKEIVIGNWLDEQFRNDWIGQHGAVD
jgi:hypothetical protein